MLNIIICLIIGYALGCISTGYLVGKLYNVDIRQHGSGNAGTTNALRTLGLKAGITTFLGDALKAIIPMLCVRFFFPATEAEVLILVLYTGLGVVIGHNFPFWLSFQGGKGIAATAGVMIAFNPWFGLIACTTFIIIVAITRYVSLGSLVLALLFPVCMAIFYQGNIHMLVLSIIFAVLAFVKHHTNIKRLLTGTERKLGEKVSIDNDATTK